MDFFATGGFQQLFSDLDEQEVLQFKTMDADLNCNYETLYTSELYQVVDSLKPLESEWSLLETMETTEIMLGATRAEGHFGSQTNSNLNSEYYEIINCVDDKTKELKANYLLDVSSEETADWNNNYNYQTGEFYVNEKLLQHSLDLILPTSNDDDLTSEQNDSEINDGTDFFITREMADWEERFLDNYIEIPELIDFLPEKTPLCTDQCELFLQESTKNLKLHRKRKQSSTTGGDIEKAGYTCNFGNCCKVYAKPAHLKAHLRRHLGEKPYICSWPDCTWKFSRSDELARHRRSHSGIKPYKCDYCTKCFARSDHLTKHRKVHERRLLAASKAGKVLDVAALPYSILSVRPGRKRKNQIC